MRDILLLLCYLACRKRQYVFDDVSVKLLRSCVNKSSPVKFDVSRTKRSGIALICREPELADISGIHADMIVIVALTDGKRFQRIPVEVISIRNHPKIFICRVLESDNILRLARGGLLQVLENEILGIERESEVVRERV